MYVMSLSSSNMYIYLRVWGVLLQKSLNFAELGIWNFDERNQKITQCLLIFSEFWEYALGGLGLIVSEPRIHQYISEERSNPQLVNRNLDVFKCFHMERDFYSLSKVCDSRCWKLIDQGNKKCQIPNDSLIIFNSYYYYY